MAKSDDGYRLDALSGDFIAVVPGRRKTTRPRHRPAELPTIDGRCPFCPGHEADTEATVARLPEDGPWRVRVVTNIYPLATPDAEIDPPLGGRIEPARGAHEVVVEHPHHDVDMPDYDDAHMSMVLRAYRDRVAALSRRPGVRAVAAFRNRGRRSGSSQPHPHGQVVATPVPAPRAARRQLLSRAHHAAAGETLLDASITEETRAGQLLVDQRRGFVVWVPFAARQNHHVRVAMPGARGGLGAVPDETIDALAHVMGRTLVRVRAATGDAPYNILFESPPVGDEDDPASFWYVDILPRRGGYAGFELGTGIEVVTVSPERAAEELRAAPF